MNGKELIQWIHDEEYGRRLAGTYLAGFIHGQVACESRVDSFTQPINIPADLDVPTLIDIVLKISSNNPELENLDIGTFMYAVFKGNSHN